MTAAELPVKAQFTILGSDTLYTVMHQIASKDPWLLCTHLTSCAFFNPLQQCEDTCTFAGHTEVIYHPPTQATDSTPLAQRDP